MRKKNSITALVLALSMPLLLTGCEGILDNVKDEKETTPNKAFLALCEEFVTKTLEEDAFSAHYTISNPSQYGITYEEEDYIMGRLDMEEVEESYNEIRELLEEFESYDDNELTKEEQIAKDVLCAYLEKQLNYEGTDLLVNMFAPSSGIISNLSTNFIEYAFFEEADVEEYLLFLKDVPVFMDEVFEFTREQSEKGYFMPSYVAEKTIDVCEQFLSAENNPMLITFEDKINKLDLSQEQKQNYINMNEEYVSTYYNPVYQKSIELLEELKGTGTNNGGLVGYGELGEKYYEAIVKEKTSADIEPDELADYLDDSMEEVFDTILNIYYKDEDAYYNAASYQPDFQQPNEVMEFILDNMSDKFPKPVTEEYVIEFQNPACEIENVLAYYLTCRIDDVNYNSIKVNGSAVGEDSLTMYLTLAHEGFPGHLYQYTACYDNEDINNACKLASFIGMTEGWAEYASTLCLEYLGISEEYQKMIYLEDMLSYIVCSRLDVGVNYQGWTIEDAEEYLAEYYYVDDDFVEEFYYMVIGDPGQFLPYTYGHLQMRELREFAENKLGSKFDEKEYHQFIIDLGITSFEVLEKELKSWLAQQ